MKKERLMELAGLEYLKEADDYDEDMAIAQEEEKMMVELQPIKDKLDKIFKKYPHASRNDVTEWLSQ